MDFKHFFWLFLGKKADNTTIFIFLFLFILWTPVNSSSELFHYIEYTFAAKTVTSYLKDANLTSLFRRCRLQWVMRSQILSSCLLDRLFKDRSLSSLFLYLSHSWQVSTLNFLNLRTSFSSLLNMFVKVEKLITGPLFLFLRLVVIKWGCSRTNWDHIWCIEMLESKYFLHPLLALL